MTAQAPQVSIFHQQAATASESVEYVVTLPTFRRPDHLVKTLKTVISQDPGASFAIIVMENDADGLAGAHAAREFFLLHKINALVVIAHDRGNCHAYNAGWTTAMASYPQMKALAVIDDDEIASPSWLENLVLIQKRTGADIVGGPQLPDFEDRSRAELKRHPVFMPHYDTSGPVPILYSSGNVLITAPVLAKMPVPYLDPVFNFTGGGDSDFYRRCRAEGFCFAWANEAWVTETVPARRTEQSWIRARSLRTGALSAQLAHRARPGLAGRFRTILHSLLLLAASPFRGIRLWRKTGVASTALFHFYVAVGRLMAEFGVINEQYRNPEKN
jgi:GT2 family glycosyltransferase